MQANDPVFILYVDDMERALAFYRDTFELRQFVSDGQDLTVAG